VGDHHSQEPLWPLAASTVVTSAARTRELSLPGLEPFSVRIGSDCVSPFGIRNGLPGGLEGRTNELAWLSGWGLPISSGASWRGRVALQESLIGAFFEGAGELSKQRTYG
jgi:hypothetical protein